MFCKYECGYGLKDHCKDPQHMRSIKHDCLAHFSIKRFHTLLDVMEITFYHQIHTRTNGCSLCMWPKVHIMDVNICSTCVSQVKGVYMDPIRVRVHSETNLWQAQRNLVGTSECKWTNDLGWFLTTPRYLLVKLKTQEGHSTLAHKLNVFH
jgi:hypothetical protein